MYFTTTKLKKSKIKETLNTNINKLFKLSLYIYINLLILVLLTCFNFIIEGNFYFNFNKNDLHSTFLY